MPTNSKNIMQTYLSATEELRKVLDSFDATPAQKDAAEASLADLTTALASHSVRQVEGRTALLTALIVELNGVIDRIRVNPIGEVLGRLNGLLGTANQLLAAEKGAAREGEAAAAPVGASGGESAAAPVVGLTEVGPLESPALDIGSRRKGILADADRKALWTHRSRGPSRSRAARVALDPGGRDSRRGGRQSARTAV